VQVAIELRLVKIAKADAPATRPLRQAAHRPPPAPNPVLLDRQFLLTQPGPTAAATPPA